MKKQGMFFRDIKDKGTTIYLPILNAFEEELQRLCRSFGDLFVGRLFRYLLGRYDFYKIILKTSGQMKSVAIQSVNIGGSLDYGPKWKIPDRIHSINRRNESLSTIEVIFDGGWNISFRLHNASSKVEPSLKFDIQLVKTPINTGFHSIKIV
ncbi:hypothetical protein LSO9J_110002 [Candidatus Liberibacter solanacearum]